MVEVTLALQLKAVGKGRSLHGRSKRVFPSGGGASWSANCEVHFLEGEK